MDICTKKVLVTLIITYCMSTANQTALANIAYTQPTQISYGLSDTFGEMLVTDEPDAKVNIQVHDYVGTASSPGDNVILARPRLHAPIVNGHEGAVPPMLSAFMSKSTEEQQNFRDVLQATYAAAADFTSGATGGVSASTYLSGDGSHAALVGIDAETGLITAFTNTATRGWGYNPPPITVTVTATCNYYKYAGQQPPTEPKSFVIQSSFVVSWSLVNAVHDELHCVLGHNPPAKYGENAMRYPGAADYSYYTQLYMSPALKVAAGQTRPPQKFATNIAGKPINELPKWAEFSVYGLTPKLLPPSGGFSNAVNVLDSGQVHIYAPPVEGVAASGDTQASPWGNASASLVATTAIPQGNETAANVANIASPQYGTTAYEIGRLEVWADANTANNATNTPRLVASIHLRYAWYEYYHYWYFAFVRARLSFGSSSPPMPFAEYKKELDTAMTNAAKVGGHANPGQLNAEAVSHNPFGNTSNPFGNTSNPFGNTSNPVGSQAAGVAAIETTNQGVPEYGIPAMRRSSRGCELGKEVPVLSAKVSPCEQNDDSKGESASDLSTAVAQAAKQMGMKACSHRTTQALWGAAGTDTSVGCEAWALSASSYNQFNKTVACSMSSTAGSMSTIVKQSIQLVFQAGDNFHGSNIHQGGNQSISTKLSSNITSQSAQAIISASTTKISDTASNFSKETGGWGSPQSGAKMMKVLAENVHNQANSYQVHNVVSSVMTNLEQTQQISFVVGDNATIDGFYQNPSQQATVVASAVVDNITDQSLKATNYTDSLNSLTQSLINAGTGPIQNLFTGISSTIASIGKAIGDILGGALLIPILIAVAALMILPKLITTFVGGGGGAGGGETGSSGYKQAARHKFMAAFGVVLLGGGVWALLYFVFKTGKTPQRVVGITTVVLSLLLLLVGFYDEHKASKAAQGASKAATPLAQIPDGSQMKSTLEEAKSGVVATLKEDPELALAAL